MKACEIGGGSVCTILSAPAGLEVGAKQKAFHAFSATKAWFVQGRYFLKPHNSKRKMCQDSFDWEGWCCTGVPPAFFYLDARYRNDDIRLRRA